jgi:hypothetical protein
MKGSEMKYEVSYPSLREGIEWAVSYETPTNIIVEWYSTPFDLPAFVADHPDAESILVIEHNPEFLENENARPEVLSVVEYDGKGEWVADHTVEWWELEDDDER